MKKRSIEKLKPKKVKIRQKNKIKVKKIQAATKETKTKNTKNNPASEVMPINVTQQDRAKTIKNFYKEWEANWGPALTSIDREFLESANSEIVAKVIYNGRLTLKSPYLKANYNGLKDLQEISDLIEHDKLAKEKVLPVFKDYWDRKPEQFTEFLFIMHDKGIFPTRSGERKLSLDPRLVPEWLGLAS